MTIILIIILIISVSKILTKMAVTGEERIGQLLAEGQRLSGQALYLVNKIKYVDLVYDYNNRVYIYARVEVATGDIYSQSGKMARGNIFDQPYYGFNLINERGVIVNNTKLQRRWEELQR